MPNWVSNKLECRGSKEDIELLKNMVKGEESEFDFNKIIAMPESLMIDCSTKTNISLATYRWIRNGDVGIPHELSMRLNAGESVWQLIDRLEKQDLMNMRLGRIAYENIRKYGHPTWYEWCCANWDTKWNACDASVDMSKSSDGEYELEYTFNTAWDRPTAVIRKLVSRFKDVQFIHTFANEDFGSTAGLIEYENGDVMFEDLTSEGDENHTKYYEQMWGALEDEE